MIEKIIAEIEQENDWREKDFAKIKYINSLLPTKEMQILFLRMSVPYIYAHWEGFVIDIFKKTLEYLNSLELKSDQVSINVFVLSLRKRFDYLKGKQSFEQQCQFSEHFISALKQELTFNKKEVNTHSNLKFEVLAELFQSFGLNIDKFNSYKSSLNQFVHIRNSIAHGENSYVFDLEKIENYIELVNTLIFLLQEEIKIYLQEKKYLKKNPSFNS